MRELINHVYQDFELIILFFIIVITVLFWFNSKVMKKVIDQQIIIDDLTLKLADYESQEYAEKQMAETTRKFKSEYLQLNWKPEDNLIK